MIVSGENLLRISDNPLGVDNVLQDELTDVSSSRLRVGCWNVGGLYGNHEKNFNICKDHDIVCLTETFLEDCSTAHLRVPHEFHISHLPGERNFEQGRASGGYALLVKTSVAKPGACSFVAYSAGICVAKVKMVNEDNLVIVLVYRAARPRSPVYAAKFHHNLLAVLDEFSDQDVLLLGDFNTKLGDMSGPLGLIDYAETLLPQRSESAEVDDHAAALLGILLEGGMYAIYDQSDPIVRNTFRCRKSDKQASDKVGGSLIDLVFANHNLFPNVVSVTANFFCLTNHALLTAVIEVSDLC
jgi:hypothetical protein